MVKNFSWCRWFFICLTLLESCYFRGLTTSVVSLDRGRDFGPSTLKVSVAWRAHLWLAEAQNLRATTKAMIELMV